MEGPSWFQNTDGSFLFSFILVWLFCGEVVSSSKNNHITKLPKSVHEQNNSELAACI